MKAKKMLRAVGRPRNFDRDIALSAACVVFWTKGYSATSVAELCDAMGINSPSLYSTFKSKEALYAESLRLYGARTAEAIWKPFESARTARDAFAAFLGESAKFLSDSNSPKGCMLALSNVDGEGEGSLGQIVRRARADNLRTLETRLEAAVTAGEFSETIDVKSIARLFLGIQQGISRQARDGASEAELLKVVDAAMLGWPR